MRVPGRVVLTEAALASLLALVAHEVPGVVGMAPAGLKDQVGRILGRQEAGEGVVVRPDPQSPGRYQVDLYVVLAYGTRVPALAEALGERLAYAARHLGGWSSPRSGSTWWGCGVAEAWGPEAVAEAFRYATRWFQVYVEELNALNVYPVPDGDTGTNMLHTLEAARRELDLADTSRMDQVARALAYGSLLGARGNSGVILSQILRGFAEALKGKRALDGSLLRRALRMGAESGYKAVMRPVEGTILTVARAAGEGARGEALEEVLETALGPPGRPWRGRPNSSPSCARPGWWTRAGRGTCGSWRGCGGTPWACPYPSRPRWSATPRRPSPRRSSATARSSSWRGWRCPWSGSARRWPPSATPSSWWGPRATSRGTSTRTTPTAFSLRWPASAGWSAPRWRT